MKNTTLKQVKGEIELNRTMGYNVKEEEKAYNFVKGLISGGVDLNIIYFNDFKNCPRCKVAVGNKIYKRFSQFDLKNCLRSLIK